MRETATTTTEDRDTARRLDRRTRLLDAFVAQVGHRGCEHTRITEVCRASGVSNRAFYATFSDKENCYLAAFDDRADRVAAQATNAGRCSTDLDFAAPDQRVARGMSKAELARRVGACPEAVRRLFAAKGSNPTRATVVALARELDLDLMVVPTRELALRADGSEGRGSR